MKPERRIERFLRRIDVIPDAERKRLRLEELLEVRGKTKKPTLADTQPTIRSIIMNKQIWKVAAVLVFAATVIGVVGILQNGDQAAYAFEQTVTAMRGKRSFHIQTYYDSPTKRHDEFWAEFDEDGKVIRVRQLDQWSKEDRPNVILWQNQVEHKYIPGTRGPGHSRSGILEISRAKSHVDVNKLVEFDPETIIEEINKEVEDGLATIKVDNSHTWDGNLVVEVTMTYDPYRRVMLVDPETKLVLRWDLYDEQDDEGNWIYNRGIEVLEYNKPLDPRLFKPNFPGNTIIIDQLSREVGMAQGALDIKDVASEILRRALEAWAADDYNAAGKLFGGAQKEFFMERAFLKPAGDIDIVKPVFDPIEPGRLRFRVNCRYTTEQEGRRTTVNKRYWVTTVGGQPGRWYILHYIVTPEKDDDDDVMKEIPDSFIKDPAKSEGFLFKDNNLDYQPISTSTQFYRNYFKLSFLGLAKDDAYLYIKLVYDSPINSWVGVRLAGDEPGLREFLTYGTEVGKNLLIIRLEIEKVVTYPTHICIEIGDSHSVVIDKDTVDDFTRGTSVTSEKSSSSERLSFKDNNLDYQPISTRTKFYNKGFRLPFLGLARDDAFLYIKLVYVSPIKEAVGIRLAGDKDISDAHDLSEFLGYGTEIGKNLLIIRLETRKVASYPTHICVEIGDDHSVVIDKEIVDDFIARN